YAFLSLFFSCDFTYHYLHSFPTRRSSDLLTIGHSTACFLRWQRLTALIARRGNRFVRFRVVGMGKDNSYRWGTMNAAAGRDDNRSEEHTSELQSRFDLVCRLLLEKKRMND